MNDLSPGSFGENEDLLVALGLVDQDGNFRADWLSDPQTYLKRILSDEKQRNALLDFVARARGGEVETGPKGRTWVPLFDQSFKDTSDNVSSKVAFFVVVDDDPTNGANVMLDEVHLFLGVRFTTLGSLIPSTSSLMVPLFRAGTGANSVSPDLLGQPGGAVSVSTQVDVASAPPDPGEAGLQRVGLSIEVPTAAGDGDPEIGLILGGLQLPGESSGRDVVLDFTDPSTLQSEAINLLIALIQAQTDAQTVTTLQAFAKMLGLLPGSGVPRLPIEGGIAALGDWLAQTFGDAAARDAWLGALVDLFGNGATVTDGVLSLPLGPLATDPAIKIGIRSETGAAGRPVITVSAAAGFTDNDTTVAARADIVRIDLGTQTALALPDLRADMTLDISGLNLGPNISVQALAIGFALNADRQPIFILELQQADVFGTPFDRLDLTNPDALAAQAAQAANGAFMQVLEGIDPRLRLIGIALGLDRPTGALGTYPTVDLLALLSNPIGTLKAHWQTVLDAHAADVTRVLVDLRRLITGDDTANAVTGTGTDADPWRLPLEAGVFVAVWRDGAGQLVIGLGLSRTFDALGDRCTTIETRLRVALVALDLSTGRAGILPEVNLRAVARARGGGRLELGAGPILLSVDHFGLAARWTPDTALTLRQEASNPALSLDGIDVPLSLPDFGGDFDDFRASWTDEHWELIETLALKLADLQPGGWLSDLMDMVGWRRGAQVLGPVNRHRLALRDLMEDAGAALRAWLLGLLADADAQIERQLRPLARLLGGHGAASFSVTGRGSPQDPWRLMLAGVPGLPALAVWRQPDTAPPRPDPVLTRDLRRWRPGADGLTPDALARALAMEYREMTGVFGDTPIGDVLDEAIPALAALWQGGDGRVKPLMAPLNLPNTSMTIHVTANDTAQQIFDDIDLSEIFAGAPPASVIRVHALASSRPVPDGLDPARMLDLRDGNRDPLAYTPLTGGPGQWDVLVPPRAEDAQGVDGQVARIRYALSQIAAPADAVVLAAPGAGHAAWAALRAMGAGLDRLVCVGLPVTAAQVPAPLSDKAAEMMRRLAEFVPHPDLAVPDDADLATARRLLAAHLEAPVGRADLALPPGWTPTGRAGLDIRLVYGVLSQRRVNAAMTAMVAAGLSLNAQARAAARAAMDLTSASFGIYLPLSGGGTSGVQVKGHALAEILGVDLELDPPEGQYPAVTPRDARNVSLSVELSDAKGWLIGGPKAQEIPLNPELRSLEIEVLTTIGGGAGSPDAGAKANLAKLVLHGVRLGGRSYPKLTVTTTEAGTLGIDGAAAPTAAEVVRMLEPVFRDLVRDAANPAVARIREALALANIIDEDGYCDPLSLANWLDDPSARLREQLSVNAARDRLMALVNNVVDGVSGVTFDSLGGSLTLGIGGSTGFALIDTWGLSASFDRTGVTAASLRLGSDTKTHIAASLRPFAVTLNLAPDEAAAFGDLPSTLPLWPAPDAVRMGRALLPQLMAAGLSEILTGLRGMDATVRGLLDGVFVPLGLLRGLPDDQRVVVPALLFIDAGAWLRQASVLGAGASGINPAQAVQLFDALRAFTGLNGAGGRWDIATGVALRARVVNGALVVDVAVDDSAFMTAAAVDLGGAFGLEIATDGRVRPAVALFIGPSGGVSGRQAVHFTVEAGAIGLFFRDTGGADLEIYPNPANLSQFAMAGLQAALPVALDAVVDALTNAGSPVGPLILHIGNALDLTDASDDFDAAKLSQWITNPVQRLRTGWPSLFAATVEPVLQPVLPNGVNVSTVGAALDTTLVLSIAVDNAPPPGVPPSAVTVIFHPGALWVEVGVDLHNLPVLKSAEAAARFDFGTAPLAPQGLSRVYAKLGPAEIPLGHGVTLRPVAELEVGTAVSTDYVSAGLAVGDAADAPVLEARYIFGGGFEPHFNDSPAIGDMAQGLAAIVVDLLGGYLLEIDKIAALLEESVGSKTVRDILANVVLTNSGTALDVELFRLTRDPTTETEAAFRNSKLKRVFTLIDNLLMAGVTVTIDGLTIRFEKRSNVLGVGLELTSRLTLVDGEVSLWLENDNTWIEGTPSAGVSIGLVRLTDTDVDFQPSIAVNGLGLRVGGQNAPLMKTPIGIGSVALHIYADVAPKAGRLEGGAQVQIAELAIGVDSGSEGSNPVAAGLLSETSDGDADLAPAFSPALSVQSDPNGPGVLIDFTAGDGDGPWWLPIRQQFGPLYVDQIGVGRQLEARRLSSISVLFDGGVSIAGLTAAVDDLELRHTLEKNGIKQGIFDPKSWSVDLAGLAVAADISGVMLAGGLRKLETPIPNPPPQTPPEEVPKIIEYIGMLNARFSTYGLSIYGGYGEVPADSTGPAYTSFFAYGAVLGPFGGPPAFFLTGVGGGFGINREINPPTNLDEFGDFSLIKALDPSAQSSDPMQELERVRSEITNKRGTFWFAAGISFTSFMIVDGIAVVAVEFGNGFELSIFGLARAALPRPQAALVSIELGLIARFSSSEGVIWIQAQLTENSWLLHPSARLTGGFAYVSWFKGDKAGEFVITLGGYHPNFHREGYPEVPRLGYNWQVSNNISIKAETYFALTSEAIMAGGLFEASARFGAAFANLSFGGNALVYFDPFSYEADAHASVSAGIRIKTFLGTIRLSFSLGAYIEVYGPEFHGNARVEVGPIDIRVRFGDDRPVPAVYLDWGSFVEKYLERASGDSASALSAIAGRGALPPKGNSDQEGSVPDGSSARPYEVASEFELSFTSTIPFDAIEKERTRESSALNPNLGIAPSGVDVDSSVLTLRLRRSGSADELLLGTGIEVKIRETGRFPIGVWGQPPLKDDKKVPKGDVIRAAEGVDISFTSAMVGMLPNPPGTSHVNEDGVRFDQLSAGDRKPLPLRAGGTVRGRLIKEAEAQRTLLAQVNVDEMAALSERWKAAASSPTETAVWRRERTVPMRVGLLSDRIVGSSAVGKTFAVAPKQPGGLTYTFGEAVLAGVLHQKVRVADGVLANAATRVVQGSAMARGLARMAPPSMEDAVTLGASRAVLMKTKLDQPGASKVLMADGAVPETFAAAGLPSVSKTHASPNDREALTALSDQANGRGGKAALRPGDIAAFDLPGSRQVVRFETAGELELNGGDARVVVLGAAGQVLRNRPESGRVKLPSGAQRFVVLAGDDRAPRDIAGWLDSSRVAYLGQSVARGAGALIRAEGASRARGGRAAGTGWMIARELTDQSGLIETMFDRSAQTVGIVFDGTATPDDLAALAVQIDGQGTDDQAAKLVPISGKTLIVYALTPSGGKGGLRVSVAGRSDARLDGVIAAEMDADALVARMLNGAFALDVDIGGQGAKPLTLRYRAPAPIKVPEEA